MPPYNKLQYTNGKQRSIVYSCTIVRKQRPTPDATLFLLNTDWAPNLLFYLLCSAVTTGSKLTRAFQLDSLRLADTVVDRLSKIVMMVNEKKNNGDCTCRSVSNKTVFWAFKYFCDVTCNTDGAV